jgi:hypothetical protein
MGANVVLLPHALNVDIVVCIRAIRGAGEEALVQWDRSVEEVAIGLESPGVLNDLDVGRV